MAAGFPTKANFANGDVLTGDQMNDLAGSVNLLGNVAIQAPSGTTYTPVLTDSAKLINLTNASGITMTIPPNSGAGSVAFPVGTQLLVYQGGAGQVTIAAGAGVTLRSNGTKLKLSGQYAVASVIKIATDEWVVAGNVTA